MNASKMIGIGLIVTTLAVIAIVPAFAGGWAVVTLDTLPQGVAPGVAFRIGFTVRQHGITPISDLDPAPDVMANNIQTGEVVRSTAVDDGAPGHYSAGLSLPSAGEWSWGIRAFGGQQQPMPPIVVASSKPLAVTRATAAAPAPTALAIVSGALAVLGIGLAFRRRFVVSGVAILLAAIVAGAAMRSGEPAPSIAEAAPPVAVDQGEALFVAKGCIVCHVNRDMPDSESISISIGPDLTLYSNDPAFLARWLAGPASVRPATTMPDLGLKAGEIDALIAFLNGEGDA